MDNNDTVGLIIGTILGLLCTLGFKQIAKFLVGDTKGLNSKWEPVYAQVLVFTVGVITLITCLSELLPLLLK